MGFGFVQGSFPIFVTDAHLSPISYKILERNWRSEWHCKHRDWKCQFVSTRGCTNLSHLVLAPEAGIMEWRVSMFISCTSVCFKLDQLQRRQHNGLNLKKGPVRSCLVCMQGLTRYPGLWNTPEVLRNVYHEILPGSYYKSDTLEHKSSSQNIRKLTFYQIIR